MPDIKRGHSYTLKINGHPEKVLVKELIPPNYARVETKSRKLITCGIDQLSGLSA